MHNQRPAAVHSHHIATAPPAAVVSLLQHSRGRRNSTQMYPINTCSSGSPPLFRFVYSISKPRLQLANTSPSSADPLLKSSWISADLG